MRHNLRPLFFCALTAQAVTGMAQGHTLFVAGHANPCIPALNGSTVTINVYGLTTAQSYTATLNANCFYSAELLVPDTAGWVTAGGSCGNGTFAMDSVRYSVAPLFSDTVMLDLRCGSSPPCQACFTVVDNAPFTAAFSSCSTGGSGSYTYLWDFSGPGGGGVSGDSVSHTFPAAGRYAACLNLSDANGCTSSICHQVFVDANGGVSLDEPNNCQACITMEQAQDGGQPLPFVLQLSSCSNGSGPLVLEWELPNGSFSSQATPTYQFNAPGAYGVCLHLTAANGCTSVVCDSLVVNTNGGINTPIPWYDCLGVAWGSNTVGTPCEQNGISGRWGANCTCVPEVRPCNACIVSNQAMDGNTPIPFTVNLGSCSQGSPVSHSWTLHDTDGPFLSADSALTYRANTAGPHVVCLTIDCAHGNSSTCDTLTFNAAGILTNNPIIYDCLQAPNGTNMPGTVCEQNGLAGIWDTNCNCVPETTGDCEAGFWIMQAYENGDTTGTGTPIPNTLWVWNLSNGGTGLYQFLWNFGDSTSSTDPFPTHVYAGSGPYVLCLMITDSQGCTDTYCDSLYVDDDGLYSGMVGDDGHRSTLTVNVVEPLTMGIGEDDSLSALSIWPNPAREQLNIALDSRISGTVHIEVIDLSGRSVLTRQDRIGAGNNRVQLSTGSLPAGLYALRITNGSSTITQRFVRD